MTDATRKQETASEERAADEHATGKKRVLLADDDPEIIEIVRAILEPEFIVVGSVGDGESALRQSAELKPDIVILDVSMGETDGITVARRLHERSCHTKVVFLTVHEISEFIVSAVAAGGSGYVFKSRINSDLLAALHAASSGRLFVSCKDS